MRARYLGPTFALVVAALVGSWGCRASTPAQAPAAVATVNGTPIAAATLKRHVELQRLVADGAGGVPQEADRVLARLVLDDLVMRRLLVEQAKAHHVTVLSGAVEAAYGQLMGGWSTQAWEEALGAKDMTAPELKDDLRDLLLAKKEIRQQVVDRIAVLDSAIDSHVLDHPEMLKAPPQLRLKHLVVGDSNALVEVKKRLRAGLPFAEAAMQYSHAPDGPTGGDLGLVNRAALTAEVWQKLAHLALKKVSEPVHLADGHHLFWIVERLPERVLKLEDVRLQIEARLRHSSEVEATRNYLVALKESAHVVINEQRLAQQYPH